MYIVIYIATPQKIDATSLKRAKGQAFPSVVGILVSRSIIYVNLL